MDSPGLDDIQLCLDLTNENLTRAIGIIFQINYKAIHAQGGVHAAVAGGMSK